MKTQEIKTELLRKNGQKIRFVVKQNSTFISFLTDEEIISDVGLFDDEARMLYAALKSKFENDQ